MLLDKLKKHKSAHRTLNYSKKQVIEIIDLLEPIAEENGITTTIQKTHFFGQVAHESYWFQNTREILNYSSHALMVVFRKYFTTYEIAKEYGREPEKIANRVYANRMGNGDEASGDGWKYKGRGLFQLTGKENYKHYSKDRGVDFVNNPEWLETPKWAVDSAAWFWNKHNLNKYADQDDLETITKRINEENHGLYDREQCVNIFKDILNANDISKVEEIESKKYKIHQPEEVYTNYPEISPSDFKKEFVGGQKSYSDFIHSYDFWSEPALNQSYTSSCVEYSHIGAVSKLLHNSLSYYSIIATIAKMNAWNGSSSHEMAKLLASNHALIPTTSYFNAFVNKDDFADYYIDDRFYGRLTNEFDFCVKDGDYNVYAEGINDRLDISHIIYDNTDADAEKIIDDLKSIINQKGVATISIDYDKEHVSPHGCYSEIWFKHEVKGNYWCIPDSKYDTYVHFFKTANKGWHDVIFFGYTEDEHGNGAFAIKNSWGSNSGENGNYYMSFKFLKLLTRYRKGKVGATSLLPKNRKNPSFAVKNYNDYITYLSKIKDGSVTVKQSGSSKYWWYDFANDEGGIPIGAGIWSRVPELMNGDNHHITVKVFSEKAGEGELLEECSFVLNFKNDRLNISNQSGDNEVRLVVRGRSNC